MTRMKMSLVCGLVVALSACGGLQSIDPNAAMSAGTNLLKAATLSDSDIVTLSNEACKTSDADSTIAAPSSAYATRLARVMSGFGDMTLNGNKINYKVYVTKDV